MCNHCTQDPRDQLHEGRLALRGLADLVLDLRSAGGSFEAVAPTEFAELLDLVATRIDRAADGMAGYVPRGWKPPLD